MQRLPIPCNANGEALVPGDVYDLCISRIRNPRLKLRLEGIRAAIVQVAEEYVEAASAAALHTLARQSDVGDVEGNELRAVYTNRMAKGKQAGRPVYDRILGAPSQGRCPLCGIGVVNTLDHHLPKSEYPHLSVTPNNLVPACQWCQREKSADYPQTAGEQTIHPYFDDFSSAVWLHAEVVEDIPASFRFFVRVPAGWPTVTEQRLDSHLDAFKLRILFASNAGSELAEIRFRLRKLFDAGGKDAVRDHLEEEAASREQVSMNSWKVAMYRAGADSDWFCDGGFVAELTSLRRESACD